MHFGNNSFSQYHCIYFSQEKLKSTFKPERHTATMLLTISEVMWLPKCRRVGCVEDTCVIFFSVQDPKTPSVTKELLLRSLNTLAFYAPVLEALRNMSTVRRFFLTEKFISLRLSPDGCKSQIHHMNFSASWRRPPATWKSPSSFINKSWAEPRSFFSPKPIESNNFCPSLNSLNRLT